MQDTQQTHSDNSESSPPDELDLDLKISEFLNAYRVLDNLLASNPASNPSQSRRDELLADAYACVDPMLDFIGMISQGVFSDEQYAESLRQGVSSLSAIPFIDRLLSLRQLLLTHSTDSDMEGHSDHDEFLITWIDILLSKLAHMTVVLSEGLDLETIHCGTGTLTSSLRDQRNTESLRVATQLPHTFKTFPNVLRSSLASPAVKRMVVGFLYASFVIRPELAVVEPWTDAGFGPYHLLHCVHGYLEEIGAREVGPLPTTSQQSITNAMVVALYAFADSANQQSAQVNAPSFEPRTMTVALEIIQGILTHSEVSDPGNEGTQYAPGRATLLQWGNVTPWSWTKWADPRIGMFETVTTLMSNWLLYSPEFALDEHSDNADGCSLFIKPLTVPLQGIFVSAARTNLSVCLHALYYQIDILSDKAKSSLQGPEWTCLKRVFYCLFAFLEETQMAGQISTHTDCLKALVGKMTLLFVLLRGTCLDVQVKSLVILCLERLDPQLVKDALQLQSHPGNTFMSRLDENVLITTRMLPDQPVELESSLDPTQLVHLHLLVKFIRVLASADFFLPTSCHQLIRQFIVFCSHGDQLGDEDLSYVLREDICDTLLAVATETQRGTTRKPGLSSIDADESLWNEEDICQMVVDNPRWVGTRVASALSTYVASLPEGTLDDLLCVEVWDYLRSVLILTGTGMDDAFESHQTEEMKRIEAERKENICAGLVHILNTTQDQLADYLVTSLLTRTMLDSLKPALNETMNDSNTSDSFSHQAKLLDAIRRRARS